MKFRTRWPAAALAVVVLAIAASATAGAATVEGFFERTLTVTGPVELDVKTGSGSIRVRTGEAGTVHIRATIKARSGWLEGSRDAEERVRALEQNPPIEQDGNTIRIGHIEDRDLRRNISISYEIVVPVETELRAATGSGSQTIDGVRGPVRAATGSGRLTLSNIGDEVRATTGSGRIELSSIQGSVRATTGSGGIRATGVAGAFDATTGSGGVRLEQTGPGDVEVTTGSGTIELNGVRGALRASTGSGGIRADGEPTGDWKLRAGSGGITVRLPSEAAFDLYARTSSGSISTDHPLTVQGTIKRRELRGKVRGGGYLVDMRTGSGSIHIE